MKKLGYIAVVACIAGLLMAAPQATTYGWHEDVTFYAEAREIVKEVKTYQQLEDIINNNEYVAVDVSSTRAVPCRKYDPIFEEVAKDYKEVTFCKLTIEKISHEEMKKIGSKYNLRAVPLTILFKNGKESYRELKALSKERLKSIIETNLLNKD